MKYKEFADYVVNNFIEVLGKYIDVTGASLETETIYKDNIGQMDALRVTFPNEKGVPVCYINDMYKSFRVRMEACQKETTIAQQVLDQFAENLVEAVHDIRKNVELLDPDDIFLNSLENLHMCVLSYEKNKEMLYNLPHRRWLDMVVIYRMFLTDNSSFRITNSMIEKRELLRRIYMRVHWRILKRLSKCVI